MWPLKCSKNLQLFNMKPLWAASRGVLKPFINFKILSENKFMAFKEL